jgi:ABC-type branched-subunit amino acid transport system substrate-binding protein
LTKAGIPAVICYGDLYAARLLRPHIFQMSPSYLWEARVIARYLLNDRSYRKIGVLASRSLDGDTALASVKAGLDQAGTHRLVVSRYSNPTDPEDAVEKFVDKGVESIVVEGGPQFFSEVAETLDRTGSAYESTIAAKRTGRHVRPQLVGLDMGVTDYFLPVGTVASDSYARGAHYLPIPSFERFRESFKEWWDGAEPLGWELRAYDAASMIGWAAQRTPAGGDVARILETLEGDRFGGLDVTLGPDDHTAVDQQTVGLWVRPRSAFRDTIPTNALPWLPLGRGFSIDGDRTTILNRDWRYLFKNPPPPDGPAPRLVRMRFAVTSSRSDPIH